MTRAWVTALLLLPTLALAVPPPPPPPPPPPGPLDLGWHGGLEALTDFPFCVGARPWLEFPRGIRASLTLAALPPAYVSVIDAMAVAVGAYDQSTADFVEAGVSPSFVLRAHVGWRPMRSVGFYFSSGYSLALLKGKTTISELLAATGDPLPPDFPTSGNNGFDLNWSLHFVDLEIGWHVVVLEHLSLRFAIGVAVSVGAKARVTPAFANATVPKRAHELAAEAETLLNDAYAPGAVIPSVTIALGYQFR